MRSELALGGVAHAQPAAELDDSARFEADEWSDGRVRALLAEQGLLEGPVRTIERVVVPVEAAAGLGDVADERQQHGPEERVLRACACVSARVDGRSRLPPQRFEGDSRVVERQESPAARVDERADERPVLVERRPVSRAVLLEHELDVGSVGELAAEEREGAQAEAAQGRMEMWGAQRHVVRYAAGAPSPLGS